MIVEDDDDDKPLVTKKKVTDEDIKAKIIELLKGANLEEVTKKKVREQLSEHFGVNLEDKKGFISQVINEVVAEK